ncbi:MAG: rhodanese-like domain-containing protein [Alphaproteobacteria bacterium]|jgi:rhodanese-related sulfurtransferase
MKITKGVKDLCAEAEKEIENIAIESALELANDPNVQLVDIRDVRELERDGQVPGALHAPRDMLEFWVDPDSPYYREVFGQDKKYVLFCAGGLRSALATKRLQDMGFGPVAHVVGGYGAWKQAGGPTEARPTKKG